jgi:sugar/nucleoside kinase (ribokinase family)
MSVSVVGAAAILDYIFSVVKLPVPGEVARILEGSGKTYWGGCAPNVAAGLARLGISASLVYPVGDDFPGSECEQYWRSLNIDLSNLSLQSGLPSGVAYLFFQPGAETMCFSSLGAAAKAELRCDTRLEDTVVMTPIVGSFTAHYLCRAVNEKRQVLVSGMVSPQIIDSLDDIQLIILNHLESKALCDLVGEEDISHLACSYPKCLFYITRGENGSMALQDDVQISIPAIQPERYVDPTGAGDAYSSGVIMAWLKGYDLEVGGYIGATCASFVIEAFGSQSNLPHLQMVLDRLETQAPEIIRRV